MSRPAVVPGTPYHRLARTDRYRWWRPLLELVLFGVFSIVAVGGVGGAFRGRVEADGLGGIVVLSVSLATLLPMALLAAACLRRPEALSSVLGRLRGRWLATAFVAVVAVKLLGVIVNGLLSDQPFVWPGLPTFAPLAAAIVLLVPIQSAAEEYAFRGTLLQALGAWIPSAWIPIVVSSVVFALVHAPETWILGIALGVSGLLFAVLAVRTGGLEASIALHAGNNVAHFAWEAAAGRSGSWMQNLNVDISMHTIIVDIVFDLLPFAILLALAKRRALVSVA